MKDLRVIPGGLAHLRRYSTKVPGGESLGKKDASRLEKEPDRSLRINFAGLTDAQEILWAAHSHSILMILQGTDTTGKDRIIDHVFSGVNP